MPIIRAHHPDQCTAIKNTVAQDVSLSFTALGIAVYLLSQPTGSALDMGDMALQRNLNKEMVEQFYKAFYELEQHGYLLKEGDEYSLSDKLLPFS